MRDALGPLAILTASGTIVSADLERVVGRVSIQTGEREEIRAFTARATTGTNAFAPSFRLLTIHKSAQSSQAIVYDDGEDKAYRLTLDAEGRELARTVMKEQPLLGAGEFAAAAAIVRAEDRWRDSLEKGELILYQPMPPVSVSPKGNRTINVGIATPALTRTQQGTNEIVGVILGSKQIVEYEGGAPIQALASQGTCGVTPEFCAPDPGDQFGAFQVSWPKPDPVWSFTVLRPRSTSTATEPNGTGIELRNVRFRGRLLMVRAHVPILDVKYAANRCGPYRDWLYQEDCFYAIGTDVAPGIRLCSQAPQTLCESGSDSGNFAGTAIFDEGTSLLLTTECAAGWYRYVVQWRFHLDGTIEPIMGFGATQDSCVCNRHVHHAYWRFDLAPDAALHDDTVIGSTVVQEGGPSDVWTSHTEETISIRPPARPEEDWWRVRNPHTGLGIVIKPGPNDRGASGDPFAKADNWILAYQANEISDGRFLGDSTDQAIHIDDWANGESLTGGRVVFWYHAGFVHSVDPGENEPCHLVGPRLELTCRVLNAPTAREPLCGFSIDTTTPTLTWTGVSNALGYVVRVFQADRCKGAPIYASPVLAADINSYTLPLAAGLQSGATYSWRVRAKGDGDESCDSDFSVCSSFRIGGTCSDFCEPNDSFSSACRVRCNTTNLAKLCSASDQDFYYLVASGSGMMTVELSPPQSNLYDVTVYDASQFVLCSSKTEGNNRCDAAVRAGQTYYIAVTSNDGSYSTNSNYQLVISCPVCASLISPGPVSPKCEAKISTPTPTLTWSDVSNASGYNVHLYSGLACTGTPIHTSAIVPADTHSYLIPGSVGLRPGTYSWRVRARGNGSEFCNSPFSICCSFEILDCQDFCESNDSFESACSLDCGSTNLARICSSSDIDYYKILASETGPITIRMTPPSEEDYDLYVYDSHQTVICSSTSGTGLAESCTLQAIAGNLYYIQVIGFGGGSSTRENYRLSIMCRSCTRLSTPIPRQPSCGSVVSNSTPTLKWSAVPQASGYVIKIFANDCFGGPVHTSSNLPPGATTYAVPASLLLEPGQAYLWQVRAKGDASNTCDSAFSSCCSFVVQGDCIDVCEPNDSFDFAYAIACSSTNEAKICSANDMDFFKVVADGDGTMSVTLTPPLNKDYDLYIYDTSHSLICSSSFGTGAVENCNLSAEEGETYYIQVVGFGGSFSMTSNYKLNVACQPK